MKNRLMKSNCSIMYLVIIFIIILIALFYFTPLKNSIGTADEFSSKLPVTDLYGAPRRGAVSNLHWNKSYRNTEYEKINTEGFTSSLSKIYRPHFRNIRLFKDRIYYKIKNNFYRFVRKIGLN